MNLSKFNPNTSLNQFLDGFFNSTIGDFVGSDVIATHPRVNIIEHSKNYEIELAAPGLKKEDFNISLEDNNLKISVFKKEEKKENEEERKFRRREYSFISFERSFFLPEGVNVSKIDASYEDGILSICLPKVEIQKPESKTIEIS